MARLGYDRMMGGNCLNVQKNGEIEFFRLVFCLAVAGLHLNSHFPMGLFERGAFGVEFFFLVSGYFMARSAERVTELDFPVVCGFLKRKVSTFFPYYIGAVLIQTLVLRILIQRISLHDLLTGAVDLIPEALFLQMSGLATESSLNISAVWYLSALLLSLLLLYPFAARHKKTYGIVFLCLAIFTIGYRYKLHGCLVVFRSKECGPFFDGMVRGLGEVALGAVCYQFSLYLREKPLSRLQRRLLTAVKYLGYAAVIVFSFSNYDRRFEASFLIVLALCLTLTGSEITCNIPYNRFTAYCGAISLPIYLFHSVVLRCADTLYPDSTPSAQELVLIVLTMLLFSVLFKYLCDFCRSGLLRLHQKASAQ